MGCARELDRWVGPFKFSADFLHVPSIETFKVGRPGMAELASRLLLESGA